MPKQPAFNIFFKFTAGEKINREGNKSAENNRKNVVLQELKRFLENIWVDEKVPDD